MSVLEIKNKIVRKLDTIEDSAVLETVLNYVEKLKDKSGNLSTNQLNELDKRRATYLSGNVKTTNWENIKRNLQQNHGL